MLRARSALISLAALAVVVFLVSCVTVTLDNIAKLRKGMTVDEAKSTLPLPPKNEFPVEMADASIYIYVCVYTLSSGDYKSNYFLVFRDNRLFFWGYPQEFARSTDSLINEIGEKAVATEKKLEGS